MSTRVLIFMAVVGIAAAGGLFLPGCEIGQPFRGPSFDAARGAVVGPAAGKTLLVAITQGDVASGAGRRFSMHLRKVLDGMNDHDGLVGYAVRRQLFGSRVWTMSVWIDQPSLDSFVASPAHRAAMAEGGVPRESFVYATGELPAARIPLSWNEARRILAASRLPSER